MDRKVLFKLFVLALLAKAGLASAIGSSFQMAETSNGVFVPDQDGRYDRYSDSYFGAKVTLHPPLFDDQGNYLVSPGESWTWIWERTDQPQELGRITLSYVGGDGMCWSDGYCGPLAWFAYGMKYPCIAEGNYKISVLHNSAPLGDGDYRPVRFKPAVFDKYVTNQIRPQTTTGGQAGTAEYYLVVSDDLGCQRPLPDVQVDVKSYVVENDLAHSHLDNSYGTGKFVSLGFDAVVNDSEPAIIGKTDPNGLFRARYQAKEHGIHEEVVTQLTRPATDIDPEITVPEFSQDINIEVPDLVEITDGDTQVIFADGHTCPHAHWPHWFTHNSLTRMKVLAEAYQYVTGRELSVNDASLPYGGVIDNKNSGGRDAQCHVSHRKGVDVDLNKKDSGDVNMLTNHIQIGDKQLTLIQWLNGLVNKFGGVRLREETIHFRFPN